MIVPDVNLLMHACDSRSRQHNAVRRWCEHLESGAGAVDLP